MINHEFSTFCNYNYETIKNQGSLNLVLINDFFSSPDFFKKIFKRPSITNNCIWDEILFIPSFLSISERYILLTFPFYRFLI